MNIQYISQPRVKELLLQLKWGDRFEEEMREALEVIHESELDFEQIKRELTESGLVLHLRGEGGNPYLALTDMGQAIADLLHEIEFILTPR
jgi:predicted transcriptional regulator